MKTEFTAHYIKLNRGCYDLDDVNNLKFITKKEIVIRDLFDELPIKDFCWWLAKKCELTLSQKRDLAIHCAEFSVKFFNAKFPNDKRPAQAIEAAKKFGLEQITLDELLTARSAARSAARGRRGGIRGGRRGI